MLTHEARAVFRNQSPISFDRIRLRQALPYRRSTNGGLEVVMSTAARHSSLDASHQKFEVFYAERPAKLSSAPTAPSIRGPSEAVWPRAAAWEEFMMR